MTSLREGLHVELGESLAEELYRYATNLARYAERTFPVFYVAAQWRGVVPSLEDHRDMIVTETLMSPKILTRANLHKQVRNASKLVKAEVENLVGFTTRDSVPYEILFRVSGQAPTVSSVKVQRRCGANTRYGTPCQQWVPCRHHNA